MEEETGDKCTISTKQSLGCFYWLPLTIQLFFYQTSHNHNIHFVADYVQEKAYIGRLQLVLFYIDNNFCTKYQAHIIAYMNF